MNELQDRIDAVSAKVTAAMAAKRAADHEAFRFIDEVVRERGEVRSVIPDSDIAKIEAEKDPDERMSLYHAAVRAEGHCALFRDKESGQQREIFIISLCYNENLDMTMLRGFDGRNGEEADYAMTDAEDSCDVLEFLYDCVLG